MDKLLFLKTSILFLCFVALGTGVALFSWKGAIYVYVGDERGPAALRDSYDLSNLKGSALSATSHERLFEQSRIVKSKDGIGIELGHFVTKGFEGRPVFACQTYRKIKLEFSATGEAVSGHRPKMIVHGRCSMTGEISRIDPIWIPFKDLLKRQPANTSIEFLNDHQSKVTFEGIGSNWPSSWVLDKIELLGSPHAENISLDRKNFAKGKYKPIELSWDDVSQSH